MLHKRFRIIMATVTIFLFLIVFLVFKNFENQINTIPQYKTPTNSIGSNMSNSFESPKKIYINAPFISQAPIGQWDDDIYQNACEEASILMAMNWVKGTSLTAEEATEEIKKLAEFQKNNYGHYHDRSTKDTAVLIKDYFGYTNIEYKEQIDIQDIIAELEQGNIVIVPLNGQKLKNPYYQPPGPIEHMAVIVGYDGGKDEFFVHDPGTRRGKSFPYKTSVLEGALRDYPTGYHEPILTEEKVMIIIKPKI